MYTTESLSCKTIYTQDLLNISKRRGVAVSKTNKLIIMMMMMMRRRKKRKKGKWRKEGKGENNGTKISIS